MVPTVAVAGDCSYNTSGVTIGAITFNSGYSGTFSSATSGNQLIVTGSTVDLRWAGTITGTSLNIVFRSSSAQTFYPTAAGDTLQSIQLNSSGTVTVSTNGLEADSIFFNNNPSTINLGSGLKHLLTSATNALKCGAGWQSVSHLNFGTGSTLQLLGLQILGLTLLSRQWQVIR